MDGSISSSASSWIADYILQIQTCRRGFSKKLNCSRYNVEICIAHVFSLAFRRRSLPEWWTSGSYKVWTITPPTYSHTYRHKGIYHWESRCENSLVGHRGQPYRAGFSRVLLWVSWHMAHVFPLAFRRKPKPNWIVDKWKQQGLNHFSTHVLAVAHLGLHGKV